MVSRSKPAVSSKTAESKSSRHSPSEQARQTGQERASSATGKKTAAIAISVMAKRTEDHLRASSSTPQGAHPTVCNKRCHLLGKPKLVGTLLAL